jgi:hypothetical protein
MSVIWSAISWSTLAGRMPDSRDWRRPMVLASAKSPQSETMAAIAGRPDPRRQGVGNNPITRDAYVRQCAN